MTQRSAAPDEHPWLAAAAGLAREVEGLRVRLDELADVPDQVRDLTSMVTDLAGRLLADAPDAAELARWLGPIAQAASQGGAYRAVAVLLDLSRWVAEVFLQYPDGAASLPDCWPWHGEVVEELLWLRQAWAAAYNGPAASIHAVGDWHERLRPGVARRVRASSGICAPERHREKVVAMPVAVPASVIEAVARWWALDRDGAVPRATELLRDTTPRRST